MLAHAAFAEDFIIVRTPETLHPGNALVAAKDACDAQAQTVPLADLTDLTGGRRGGRGSSDGENRRVRATFVSSGALGRTARTQLREEGGFHAVAV